MAIAIEENGHVAGGGPFGRRCETKLEQMLGQRTLLVTSATHALEMAALLLECGPGDEVILPSFTFVSTANAFAIRGTKPVFADVDLNGNLLVEQVEQLRTRKTKAIVPVHYAGGSCDLPRLLEIAGAIPVVEDAAQALNAGFGGKPLGTFGACAAFSFHETKNIGCGEGGALTIRDAKLIERAEYLRDKGTNRRKFQDGLVDKYTWVDLGSSYVLSDLNAAYLATQLDESERIQKRRREIHERYRDALAGPVEAAGGYLITGHPKNHANHHLFAIVFRQPEQRSRYIAHMRTHEIVTPFHYVSLHTSPMGRSFHDGRALPNSERLSSCLVRLPLFFNLSDPDADQVIGRTLEFLRGL